MANDRVDRAGGRRGFRRAAAVAALLGLLGVGVRAAAQASISHEFIPPDPKEDLEFSATLLDGDLPAAVQTPSGIATAPDPRRPPDAKHLYGGADPEDAPGSSYRPDRDTRRPDVENYEDPFSPSTVPFKRLRAFDKVDVDYTLRVRDDSLEPVPVGGDIRADEEPFYGDMSVDLLGGKPVRLPSVGPGFRVLRAALNPAASFELLRDKADNFFIRAKEAKRVRLVLQLAVVRDAFGQKFSDVSWSALDPFATPQPTAHKEPFRKVAEAIGVSRAMPPAAVVDRLVSYFRAFAPSNDPPRESDDIYLDLALSKKGVCRHRAFAFLVTALNLGIPARMVVNEAHAWVEVFDTRLWHRIDLGGAAQDLEQETDPSRPLHHPPPDPYGWPEQRDSGADLAARERSEQEAAQPGAADPGASDPNAPGAADPTAPGPTASALPPPPPDVDVSVHRIDKDVRRGPPLRLVGDVKRRGVPCRHTRVDVVLRGGGLAAPVGLGSLSTDDRGVYDGWVRIPKSVGLGDYDLDVQVAPGGECARP